MDTIWREIWQQALYPILVIATGFVVASIILDGLERIFRKHGKYTWEITQVVIAVAGLSCFAWVVIHH